MTALSTDRNTWYQESVDTLRAPMAADAEIFVGGMVCRDAAGYAVPADDAEGYIFAGMAIEDPQNPGGNYDNSGGDDGDVYVVVRTKGRARYALNRTPSQDMLLAKAYCVDDQTVEVNAAALTYDVQCGFVTKLPTATLAYDAEADFSTDEVEIEFSGGVDDYAPTTTTAAPTTAAPTTEAATTPAPTTPARTTTPAATTPAPTTPARTTTAPPTTTPAATTEAATTEAATTEAATTEAATTTTTQGG